MVKFSLNAFEVQTCIDEYGLLQKRCAYILPCMYTSRFYILPNTRLTYSLLRTSPSRPFDIRRSIEATTFPDPVGGKPWYIPPDTE